MKTCPLLDGFKFKTKCSIETCKYHSCFTKSNCLHLDTNISTGNKVLSDSEIVLHKLPDHSPKQVASIRKNAISRVGAILAVRKLIEHVKENEKRDKGLNKEMAKRLPPKQVKTLRKAMSSDVMYNKHLGVKVWMLRFIFDYEYAKKVIPNYQKLSINTLFGVSNEEIKKLTYQFKKVKQNG